jgi:DNA-binding NarL/FixJ family response regulator
VQTGDAGSSGASTWPFVGRTHELSVCRQGLADQRGAVIFGDGGVGKTRLAQELSAEVAAGARWHRISGSRGVSAVAFGGWAHLLPGSWAGDLDDVAAWRALADHLRSGDGSIHLFVDDAHWLDLGSANLLHHLVTAHEATALVTHRRDGTAHQPITALWKDGYLARMDLDRLTEVQVGAVVEAALGAPVEPSTIVRLHTRTGGNLLLVRELVDDARRHGALQLLHGAWVQTGPTQPSPRLVDLMADRIEDLSPDERAGAEVLAVATRLDQQLLSRLVPPSVIGRLVERGIVLVNRDGSRQVAAIADPIMGEVLVAGLGAGQRDELVRRVVDELGQAGSLRDDDALRLAVWRVELGHDIDPDEVLRAADLASSRNDFPTAERLASAGVAAGGGLPATIRLGEALMSQQRHREADTVLAPVGDQLDALDDGLRFRYASARALALSTDLGLLDEAIDVLEATIPTMADDRSRWALEGRLSFLLADCGRLTAARPLAEARMANVAEDEPSALTAFVAWALIDNLAGRCQDTLDLCETMMPIALRHLDELPEAVAWIAAAQLRGTYSRGNLRETTELCEALEVLIGDDRDPTVRAGLLMSQGLVLADRGLLDTALRVLQQAAALHEIDNRRGYQAWCFAITSRAHSLRGELDAAAEALVAARRHLWPGGQSFAGDIEVAAIWLAMLQGDRAGATRMLHDALVWTEAEGMATVALRLRHEAVRAGLPVAPHVQAVTRTTVTDQSPLARAIVAHLLALAADDGAALVEAGDQFAALGGHLPAAEAYAQGAGAHRRAGSAALATRAKQLSQTQRSRCESPATPALRFGELVVSLTDRELDVTTRAAAGEANQDIADALGISVRTAETHLQRAFSKLGIHRRSELGALFDPQLAAEATT